MRWICRLTFLALLLTPGLAVGQSSPPVGDLLQAQTRLLESTTAYRASLEQLVRLQQPEADRTEREAERRRELLDRGIVSRRELEQSERAWAEARSKVDETRARMAEADSLIAETLAAIEIARLPKAAPAEIVTTAGAVLYQGDGSLDVSSLEAFFSRRFGHALPVSARGQTPTHDRLGLDHRHAMDVALHPDSEEGRSLIDYLRLKKIPFLAFRQAVPGASTGAHIHIGQVSTRLIPVRAQSR